MNEEHAGTVYFAGNKKPMRRRKYPDMFYRYSFSGTAKCHECKNRVKKGQFVFVYQGNIYHDFCSKGLKGREKLTEECPGPPIRKIWPRTLQGAAIFLKKEQERKLTEHD